MCMSEVRSQTTVIAIASFSREDWEKLKQIAEDQDELHDTYEEWQKDVLELQRTIMGAGRFSLRISVTAEELQQWCKDNGLPLNGGSRSQYAQLRATQIYGSAAGAKS